MCQKITPRDALAEILSDIICATADDAAEIIEKLERRYGFELVATRKRDDVPVV